MTEYRDTDLVFPKSNGLKTLKTTTSSWLPKVHSIRSVSSKNSTLVVHVGVVYFIKILPVKLETIYEVVLHLSILCLNILLWIEHVKRKVMSVDIFWSNSHFFDKWIFHDFGDGKMPILKIKVCIDSSEKFKNCVS